MPEFTSILIHIINCNDCRCNRDMEKALESYEYWNNNNDGSQFIENTLNSYRNRISALASHIHTYV